jgi:hypothetical protein
MMINALLAALVIAAVVGLLAWALCSVRNAGVPPPVAADVALVEVGDDGCVICLCELHGAAKRLPCGHAYHGACIDAWVAVSATCPLCSAPVAIVPI